MNCQLSIVVALQRCSVAVQKQLIQKSSIFLFSIFNMFLWSKDTFFQTNNHHSGALFQANIILYNAIFKRISQILSFFELFLSFRALMPDLFFTW